MLFNSLEFVVFLGIFFPIYWFVLNKNLKVQNLFILVASYFFYGCWDVRFLSLIFISTIVDYTVGLRLAKHTDQRKRKVWLYLSILVNLGLLGFFKYYNFFVENFIQAFSFLGVNLEASTLNIILPVGISFYTFQTLSYTIDIYRNKFKPTHNFIDFAAYVSFFPQLVAGPIERASHLLPQFEQKRTFTYEQGVDGLRQILWGLFTKVVIADNCAIYANYIFENSDTLSGSTLLIGTIFFTFQVYGDFSGYSSIAIGIAGLIGFNLKQNFANPFFSRDMTELWRRWHITLMSWFRDYVYVFLSHIKMFNWNKKTKILVLFLLSGFWHGANWTFILFGLYNGILVVFDMHSNKKYKHHKIVAYDRMLPNFYESIRMIRTFILFMLGGVFFRSETVDQSILIFRKILSSSLFEIPTLNQKLPSVIPIVILTIIMLLKDWIGRRDKHTLTNFTIQQPRMIRHAFYYIILFCIAYFGGKQQAFIYFQF